MADGGIQLEFEFDQASVASLERRLGTLAAKAPAALANALNATARSARKDLASKARETYTAKGTTFTQEMHISRASAANLVSIIRARGTPTEMQKFTHHHGEGPGTPNLETLINKANGAKEHSNKTFFVKSGKKGGGYIASRRSAARLPIDKKFSISVPGMLGNEGQVYGVVEPSIQKNLKAHVDKQIARIMG